MKIINYKSISLISLFFAPIITYAFDLSQSTFAGVIVEIISIIDLLIPILITSAFIVFFWGLSKFILNSGSKTEIENGRKYMIWGLAVLFILLTFRTIISLISTDLDIGNSSGLPFLPTGGSVDTSTTIILPDGTTYTP